MPYTTKDLNLATSTAAKSPFVIAIKTAGIKGLPSVINAALLTSAWSASSSDLYTSSRALCGLGCSIPVCSYLDSNFGILDGLALNGNAPRIFARTNRFGLPYVAVSTCCAFGLLAYMAASSGAGHVFTWFANMTSIAGLMTWFGICVTYVRFYKGMKAQGMDRRTLPFYSRLQPYAAWYGLFSTIIICLVCTSAFFASHICITDLYYSSADGPSSSRASGQPTRS